MALSSPSFSLHSGISSSSSSSSSFSYLYSKNAPARALPRRGQIKAAIFASFFASIARLLRASTPDESANGVNSQDGVRSSTGGSDLKVDVEGRDFGTSVTSSPPLNLSGSATPDSPFNTLLRTRSYHDGMHGREG